MHDVVRGGDVRNVVVGWTWRREDRYIVSMNKKPNHVELGGWGALRLDCVDRNV